ncbi:BON domain-containing protein [Ensifer aridi]|uniref:BON domain-containing protein n=1 Tax=Ensifer aridi TaxID=1708715 RepID=UPI00111C188B|nr:BON domain-containing protein [Ensifer aridi]
MADERYRRREQYGRGYGREPDEPRGRYGRFSRSWEDDYGDERYERGYGGREGYRGDYPLRGQGYGREREAGEAYRGEYGARGMNERMGGYGREWGSRRGFGAERFGGGSESAEAVFEDQDFGRGESGYGRGFGRGYGGGYRREGYGGAHGGGYGGEGYRGGMYGGGYGEPRSDRFGQYRGRGPKGYQRSDERIREDVCDRLSDDRSVDASEIEVRVSNCEVTLSGTVEGREQKRRAEDCAEEVSGVKNVQNNLRVSQQGWTAGGKSQTGTTGTTGAGMTAGTSATSPESRRET